MDDYDCSVRDAIDQAIVGKEEGFRVLLEKYNSYAFSIAIRLIKDDQEAEEVVQDAFMRAFKNIAKFKRSGKFSTWLYRIVYNTSLTRLRKRKLPIISLDEPLNYKFDVPDNYISGFEKLAQEDRVLFLNRAIDNLAVKESLAVALYYTNQCSIVEIAEITGWNKSTIKTRLYRARQNLYDELSKLLGNHINDLR